MTQEPSPSGGIPDFIPAGLSEFLRAKTGDSGERLIAGIPQVHFSDDDPSELALLVAMFINNAKRKPDHDHLFLLLEMIAKILSESYCYILARIATHPERDTHSAVVAATMATSMAIIQKVAAEMSEIYRDLFKAGFKPAVSAQFLSDMGVSPDEFQSWVETSIAMAKRQARNRPGSNDKA